MINIVNHNLNIKKHRLESDAEAFLTPRGKIPGI